MLRLIVRTDDCGAAANVGGAVDTSFRTFDIAAPDVEALLRACPPGTTYCTRQVIGVEVIGPEPESLAIQTTADTAKF